MGEVGGQTSESLHRRLLPLWSEGSIPEEDVVLREEKEACLQTFSRNSHQDQGLSGTKGRMSERFPDLRQLGAEMGKPE